MSAIIPMLWILSPQKVLHGQDLISYQTLFGGTGIIGEAFMVAFWFFLWECGDVLAFECRRASAKRNHAAQLASIHIAFHNCPASQMTVEQPSDRVDSRKVIPFARVKHSAV